MIFKHSIFEEEDEKEIEHESIDPFVIEHVESSIRELGKHISELSRQEQID
jgi:hypothetical protein